MMRKCWRDKPLDRPSFSELRDTLEQMMLQENPYLELWDELEAQDSYHFPSLSDSESDDDIDMGDIEITERRGQTVVGNKHSSKFTTYF